MATAEITATLYKLWNDNYDGTKTPTNPYLGMYNRETIFVYELLPVFDMSLYEGVTINSAYVKFTVVGAAFGTVAVTVYLMEQDKTNPTSWSSPPIYDDFAFTSWGTQLSSVASVLSNGEYTIPESGTNIKDLVQSWCDGSSDNWGVILERNDATQVRYIEVSTVKLYIDYTIPPEYTSKVFSSSGFDTFEVPTGVHSLVTKIWGAGAGGGAGGTSGVGGAGGGGGFVEGVLSVTPGETLVVHVGGLGGLGNFVANSGGGGGGSGRSSVYRSTTPLLIAAGGGGGGGGDNSTSTPGGTGGAGGGNTGGAGGASSGGGGGGGGTQSTGGAGGTGGANSGVVGQAPAGSPGGAGGDGADGTTGTSKGGEANGGTTNGGDGGTSDISAGFAGGGGGASGYGGGGGGSSSLASDAGGGGGGGGSNYVVGTATETVNSQASGQTPPSTSDEYYVASAGVGGSGGSTSGDGSNGNDGRIVLLWVSKSDYGLLFDSANSEYAISAVSFTPSANSSVCMWAFPKKIIGTARMMGSIDNYEVKISNGKFDNDLYGSTVSVTSVQINVLYHIVCTRASDNTAQIFINGVLDNTGTNSASVTANPLSIGVRTGSSDYYYGLLEDVRVYNRVLSAGEVATIYASKGVDGIVYGLLHRWLLNEGPDGQNATGTGSIKDLGSSQMNLTPYNTPTYKGSWLETRRFV